MPESSILTFGTIGFAALLLVILFLRPSVVRSGEGKILAIVAVLAAPALAAYGGLSEHRERTRSTEYCLSCHAMSAHGASLRTEGAASIPAVHFQNHLVPRDQACYACHTDYGFSGNKRARARAMKHIANTYFGSVPDTIRMARRYRNRQCLRCHLGAPSFEQADAHRSGRYSLAGIKAGRASCTRSGCHDVVHRPAPIASLASTGLLGSRANDDPLIGMVAAPDTARHAASSRKAEEATASTAKTEAAPSAKIEPAPLIGPMPLAAGPQPVAGPAPVKKLTTTKSTKTTAVKPAKPRVKRRRSR